MGLEPTEHPEESCATSLQMRFKLIDYFVLMIHPLVLGRGLRLVDDSARLARLLPDSEIPYKAKVSVQVLIGCSCRSHGLPERAREDRSLRS